MFITDSSPGAEPHVPATSKAKQRKAPPKRRKSRKLKTRVPCEHCDKTFGRKDALLEHCKEKHNANPRRYQCPSCPKTFLRKHNRAVHIQSVHSGERPFACEHCPDKFKQRAHRSRHVEKCHMCELCRSAHSDLGAHLAEIHGHSRKKTVGSTRTLKCVCGARVKNLLIHQQSCAIFHFAEAARLANVQAPRRSTLRMRGPSPKLMLTLNNEVSDVGELSTSAMPEIGELSTSAMPEIEGLPILAMPEIGGFSISAMPEVGEFHISTLPGIGNIATPPVTEIGELPTPTNSFEGIVDIDSGVNAHAANLDNFRKELDGFNRSLTNSFLPAVLQASQWTTFLQLSMPGCSVLPFRTSLIFDLAQDVQLEMSTSGDVGLSRGGPLVSRFKGIFNRFLRRRSENAVIESDEFAMSVRADEEYDSSHPMGTSLQLIENIMAPNAMNNDDAANGLEFPKLQILRLSWSKPSARNSCGQELWAGFGTSNPLEEAIRGFPDPEVHQEVDIETAYLHGLLGQTLDLNSSLLKNASLNRLQKCVFFHTGVLVSELLTNLPSLTELVCVACVNAFDESKLRGVKSWHFFDGRQAMTLIWDHDERVGRAMKALENRELALPLRHLTEHDKMSDGPAQTVQSSMEGCGASRTPTISISKLAVWSRTPIRENETARYIEMSNSDSTKPTAGNPDFHRAGKRLIDATSLYMPVEGAKTKQDLDARHDLESEHERALALMEDEKHERLIKATWASMPPRPVQSMRFKCPICSISFKSKYEHQKHCKNHTGILHFSCHMCVEKFRSKSNLTRHIRFRHNKRCYVCKKQIDGVSMAEHFRACHPGEKMKNFGDRNLKCECGNVCQDMAKHLAHEESCGLIRRNREIIKAYLNGVEYALALKSWHDEVKQRAEMRRSAQAPPAPPPAHPANLPRRPTSLADVPTFSRIQFARRNGLSRNTDLNARPRVAHGDARGDFMMDEDHSQHYEMEWRDANI